MTIYRGARSIREQAVAGAIEQKAADKIAAKAQRVHKAAAKAKSAKDLADDHDNQLTTGILKKLDIGGMAQLQRLQGALPNANLATIQDATKLAAGLVSSRELSDLAVSAAKLADYAVGPSKVATEAVSTRAIAANAVVANAIAANAVLATHMAVQNLAAFDLWASIAMIRSAWINNLTVDKLSAGTFTAGEIILAGGGRIRGGGTWMDSSGIRMPFVGGNYGAAANAGFKITGPDDNEAVAMFRTSGLTPNYQGVQIRGDGVAGNDNMAGEVVIQSSSAGGNFGAQIEVVTKTGNSAINLTADNTRTFGTLRTEGVLNVGFGMTPHAYLNQATVNANGGWQEWVHDCALAREVVPFMQVYRNANWKPLETITDVYIEWVGDTKLRVTNNSTTNAPVRGVILRMRF